jgi:2-haloacid dehalogenase
VDFARVQALTFDCYGTLIDWETGITKALAPIAGNDVLEPYAEFESELESGPYRPYRAILTSIVDRFGQRSGFTPTEQQRQALVDSLPSWPPFPDTVDALRALKRRFKLGIISNIDDDLFAATARHLGVDFDWVVTAQQAGAYKPSHAPFELAFERIGLPRSAIVHVAQSLYHDHVPAHDLGLRSVWVNRRHSQPGSGATPASSAQFDLEVPSLSALVDAVGS